MMELYQSTEILKFVHFFLQKNALRSVPGAEHQLLRQHRIEADEMCQTYMEKKGKANKELR